MLKTLSAAEKFLVAVAVALIAVLVVGVWKTAGAQPVVPTATLSLPTLVTQYTDGSVIPDTVPITYQIWQGEKGANKALTVSDWDGKTPAVLTAGLKWNSTTCWKVSTKAGTQSSDAWSPEVCKTFGAAPVPAVRKPKPPATVNAT